METKTRRFFRSARLACGFAIGLSSAFFLGWSLRGVRLPDDAQPAATSPNRRQSFTEKAESAVDGRTHTPAACSPVAIARGVEQDQGSRRWNLLSEIARLSRGGDAERLRAAELLLSSIPKNGKTSVEVDLAGAIRVQDEAFIEWLLLQTDPRLRELKAEAIRYLHAPACRISVETISRAASEERQPDVAGALIDELFARRENASIETLIATLKNCQTSRDQVRKIFWYMEDRFARNPKDVLGAHLDLTASVYLSELRLADSRFSCTVRGILVGESEQVSLPEPLQSGDLLVLIDGVPPKGIRELRDAARRAKSEGRVLTLDLWRQGAQVKASCAPDYLDEIDCWYLIPR